jgi:hypothetical protein
MKAYSVGFDAAVVDPAALSVVIADASAIAKMATVVCSLAGARLADTDAWKTTTQATLVRDCARVAARRWVTWVQEGPAVLEVLDSFLRV